MLRLITDERRRHEHELSWTCTDKKIKNVKHDITLGALTAAGLNNPKLYGLVDYKVMATFQISAGKFKYKKIEIDSKIATPKKFDLL
jgi:hypothetical protein